jgi:hypothetical protein
MKKSPKKISLDLTIPEFDVKVKNNRFCQVISKDGRYEFEAKIKKGVIKISGPMFSKPLKGDVGPWAWGGNSYEFTTDADDVITHVANLLRLMDVFSRDGFSAKINQNMLVLSHSSRPDYSLCMWLTDARKFVFSPYTAVYTPIKYCGPAYDEAWNPKWHHEGAYFSNIRLAVANKKFEELSKELKTRILTLGEPDPRIAQWVTQEVETALLPQGFTFTPRPEKASVEISHPSGLSGSLSFAHFTAGAHTINTKFPNPHFPTDLEGQKVVLFACALPNNQEPYTRAWSANEPDKAINDIHGLLALVLLHEEICKEWKSDILIPKWENNSLHLVNTKLNEGGASIFTLTSAKEKLILTGGGEERSYPFSDILNKGNTKKITREIVVLAEKHVQEFLQKTGGNRPKRIIEIDL